MRSTTSRLAAVALALVVSGCAGPVEDTGTAAETPASTPSDAPSSEEPTSASPTPEASPSETPEEPAGPVLEVTVKGDRVTPNAQQLEVAVGEPLLIEFRSDRAGELHVHSKPEQYVDFGAGASRTRLVVETPGTVEVEEHESGAVVAVLEVR